MNKYDWKLKSFAKGINPDLAVEELSRIENLYGSLTPENILKAAEPEDSVLHPLFEWSNDRAAELYRLQQARTILNNIEVVVVKDGQSRNISVYEVVNLGEGRTYKHIDALTTTDVEQIKKQTLQDLTRVKTKLSFYKDFEVTIKFIDSAIESI
jgi:hypothetical protein